MVVRFVYLRVIVYNVFNHIMQKVVCASLVLRNAKPVQIQLIIAFNAWVGTIKILKMDLVYYVQGNVKIVTRKRYVLLVDLATI